MGFIYPWIIPPRQVYTPYLFPDFTGLGAAYQFNIGTWDIEAEAYWGHFEGDVSVDVKADNPRGLILETGRGNLLLRAAYHLVDAGVEFPQATRSRDILLKHFCLAAGAVFEQLVVVINQPGGLRPALA